MDTTEDDTKTFEFTESATTTTYATTTDADGEGEGDGDGDGVGGLQVAEMPNLNMDGIMEEVARGSKEEDVDAAAKAEKRKRLKEARNKRFGLEPEVVEQTIEEEVEEEEVSEEVPDTEPEPQKKPPPPQPVSETDEPQDIYALDELEAAKLMEVVSEISVASTPSYDDNAIQRKSDFLKLFEMPSFSDISSEESVIVVRPKKKAPSPRVSKRASSRKKSKLVVESEEPTAAGESSDKEDEESSSSALIEIDSSDLALDKFKPREVPTVGFGDTAIEIFDMIQDGTAKVQQMRMSEMLRTKHKRELDTLVAEFVDQLLCDTVNKYEIGLVELMQRGRFDKMKLYNDLQNTVDNCLIEQQKNNYLNLKMVEYHRRNKNFRAFDKLAPKLAKFEHERYQIALCQLDFAKQKAAEAKKKNAYLMSSVMMDLMHIQNLNIDIEEHLDTVFRNTFALKSEGFRKHVEREMRHMQNTRYEISDVRLALITRKHTLGIIKERISILEHINDDIEMNDFINLQNQVASLFKKIEEKNNELKKARINHTTNVHFAQHNREKVQALTGQRLEAASQLKSIRDKQQGLRKQLFDAKIKKKYLRKKITELKFKGGLLAMPNLMHDYDNTKQKVKEKRQVVRLLRDQVKRLTERIGEYESRLKVFKNF